MVDNSDGSGGGEGGSFLILICKGNDAVGVAQWSVYYGIDERLGPRASSPLIGHGTVHHNNNV